MVFEWIFIVFYAKTTKSRVSNSFGGKIFVGVDDKGSVIGIEINEETIQQYINTIKQNTQPGIIVDINTYEIKNKTVLEIDVKEYP